MADVGTYGLAPLSSAEPVPGEPLPAAAVPSPRAVGPFQIEEPAWVPEPGTWHHGGAPDGTIALLRIPTFVDAPAAERQRDVLRRISDPRIPSVLAAEPETGAFAITGALGTPLSEAIDQRTEEGGNGVVLTPATLLDILTEIGRAVASAHTVGIVHGSLDPDRVLFGQDGRIWIFGFGSGVDPGTPWLPPEIARGGHATAATDQWSLAALGTGLVLGHPIWPWHSKDSVGTPGGAITTGDCTVLIDTIGRQWPALAGVLARALAPDPAARYTSMSAFVRALEDLALVAGGSSERRALGAWLWARWSPPAHAHPAPMRPTPPLWHPTSGTTTTLDPEPDVVEFRPAPSPAITRVAYGLVGLFTILLLAATLSRC